MLPHAERSVLLLVEDEMMIQEVIGVYLSSAGFGVATHSNAMDAIAELELQAIDYAAVITDIRLGSGVSTLLHHPKELIFQRRTGSSTIAASTWMPLEQDPVRSVVYDRSL